MNKSILSVGFPVIILVLNSLAMATAESSTLPSKVVRLQAQIAKFQKHCMVGTSNSLRILKSENVAMLSDAELFSNLKGQARAEISMLQSDQVLYSMPISDLQPASQDRRCLRIQKRIEASGSLVGVEVENDSTNGFGTAYLLQLQVNGKVHQLYFSSMMK